MIDTINRRMPAARCPFCNCEHDAVTAPTGRHTRQPKTGDFALCMNCGEWTVFDDGLSNKRRKPTWEEYQEIASNPQMKMMRAGWVHVTEERKRKESNERTCEGCDKDITPKTGMIIVDGNNVEHFVCARCAAKVFDEERRMQK